jgi:uncharacterized membrane protein
MPSFTVWKFDSAAGADEALSTLERLQKEGLIEVQDAAVVTWPEGAAKPQTEQLTNLKGKGALGGAFWGFLFGLIFFVPLFGLAIGAALGALGGSLSDAGIDGAFIEEVRRQVAPGTSALFLMSADAVLDRVSAAFGDAHGHVTLIHTNLTSEQEAKLRAAFAEDEAHAPV